MDIQYWILILKRIAKTSLLMANVKKNLNVTKKYNKIGKNTNNKI